MRTTPTSRRGVDVTCKPVLALACLLIIAIMASSAMGQQPIITQPVGARMKAVGVDYLQPTGTPNNSLESISNRLRLLESKIGEGDNPTSDDSAIEKLEEKVGKIKDGLPGMLFHSHKSPKMSFFGRIHLDYWAFPGVDDSVFPIEGGNPQDRFNFRRLRIGVKGNLYDNMFYKYEGEFAGGINPSYRDAYIGFDDLPLFQKVFIGNHKRPYGLDHLNSSRYNVFIERPFIVEAFNQDSRRIGISSNGVSKDQKYNWRTGVYNQQLTQASSGYIGDHYQLELASRLAKTAWYDESSGGRGYFHWAVSGSIGTPDGRGGLRNQSRYRTRPEARSTRRWLDTGRIAGANTSTLLGLETVFNYGAFQFTGEYMTARVDRSLGYGPSVQFDGAYVQTSYFLTGEHIPWNRRTGTIGRIKPFENFFSVRDGNGCRQRGRGAWQIAARYSYADLTDDDIIGGEAQSLTLGLNWYWNQHARMQFNYITGDLDPAAGNVAFGDYNIIGIRAMVDF